MFVFSVYSLLCVQFARASVGVVEGKLLSRKVDSAIEAIDAVGGDNPEMLKVKQVRTMHIYELSICVGVNSIYLLYI